jgi:hypothetical protein
LINADKNKLNVSYDYHPASDKGECRAVVDCNGITKVLRYTFFVKAVFTYMLINVFQDNLRRNIATVPAELVFVAECREINYGHAVASNDDAKYLKK